jgi:hypothetical protein
MTPIGTQLIPLAVEGSLFGAYSQLLRMSVSPPVPSE